MKSEWNIGTISEVCSLVTDGSHYSPKSCDNGEYMVSVKDFKGFGFDFSNCKHISSSDYEKMKASGCIPECGDILIGKDGARFFEDIIIYNQPEKPALLSSIAILRCNPDIILPQFLYYICKNPVFKKDVRDNYGSGSAIPRIVLKDFKRMPISYPNLDEQRRIVASLVAIDDRILLNTAINENLESQAQMLCEKWVSEHAESIIMRSLSEIAEINPDTYSPKGKWEFINYLDTSSITNGVMSEIQMINPDTDKLPSRARRIIKANDIVYSTVRPNQLHFGIISDPMENMLASTGFAVIRSKHTYISSPYLYHFLTSPDFIEKMQQLAEQSASTFPSVKPSDIGTCMIPCADKEEMIEINEQVTNMYAMVSANHKENRQLTDLRDTLLPKLMNGEIDVSKVRI